MKVEKTREYIAKARIKLMVGKNQKECGEQKAKLEHRVSSLVEVIVEVMYIIIEVKEAITEVAGVMRG